MKNSNKHISKLINSFLDFHYYISPFLYISAITLIILESFTYPGFLKIHTPLSVGFIYFVALFSIILSRLTHIEIKKQISSGYKILFYLSVFLIPPIIVFSILLSKYSSPVKDSIFLYRSVLIYPDRIYLAESLIIFFTLIHIFFTKKAFGLISHSINKPKINKDRLVYLMFVFFSILILLNEFSLSYLFVKKNLGMLVRNPGISYDAKMRYQIGPVYDYYKFVVTNTENNSVILKPEQQGRWPDVSNEGFSRYFLYPRTFVSEENLINGNLADVDYIFLIGSEALHNGQRIDTWPDFDVSAENIILYDPKTLGTYKAVEGDYKYLDFQDNIYWGIIKVSNDN